MKNKILSLKTAMVAIFAIISTSVIAAESSPVAPAYKVDTSYDTNAEAGVVYMAITSKDEVCVLFADGTVKVFDTDGKEKISFKAELDGIKCAIAADNSKIYVIATEFDKDAFKKAGGKIPKGAVYVNYGIFDMTGKKEKSIPVAGALNPASARIIKDKLVIADKAQCAILICDVKTGKIKKTINEGFHICCGIFDFCKGPKDTIMVANLGAFKVSSFSITGAFVGDFGKRGKGIDDFHGCCNPVSVAVLPDGSIATVEKDTTRVKIYDKKGKKANLISGIDELVKGCTHIPMVTDSKGNIYLASKASNKIIKCVADKEVASVKSN